MSEHGYEVIFDAAECLPRHDGPVVSGVDEYLAVSGTTTVLQEQTENAYVWRVETQGGGFEEETRRKTCDRVSLYFTVDDRIDTDTFLDETPEAIDIESRDTAPIENRLQ